MKGKVKSTVLKVASERLQPHGFEYDNERSVSKIWTFSRQVGDITEYVAFELSDHSPNSIRMRISNSKNGLGAEVCGLMRVPKIWWQYYDQESLEKIVHYFVDVFCEKGPEWLHIHQVSIPKPSEDVQYQLIENSEGLALSFCEKYDLHFDDPQLLKNVELMMLERKKEMDFGEFDLDLALGAAAYLSEFIRRSLGGEWEIDQKFRTATLVRIGGGSDSFTSSINSLTFVLRFWYRYPYATGLYSIYNKFLSTFS